MVLVIGLFSLGTIITGGMLGIPSGKVMPAIVHKTGQPNTTTRLQEVGDPTIYSVKSHDDY